MSALIICLVLLVLAIAVGLCAKPAHADESGGDDPNKRDADPPASDSGRTFTQKEVDELMGKVRAEERRKLEDERKKAEMTESERHKTERDEALRKAAQLELEVLKRDLCDDAGIPANLRKYIAGADEAAIRGSIEALKKDFSIDTRIKGKPEVATGGGTGRNTGSSSMNDLIRRAAGVG